MEIHNIVQMFASAAFLYSLYTVYLVYHNYRRVRYSGFPIYWLPLNLVSPAASVFMLPLLPLLKKVLPASWYRPMDLCVYGYEWRDRVAKQERPQPGYMIVCTSNDLNLYVSDAEIASHILTRRRDFEQDPATIRVMSAFGPNLAGTTGEQWQRQRRIIAPLLNERIMQEVWSESRTQAADMLTHFMTAESGVTKGTMTGLRDIAINILQTIGYGMSTKWGEKDTSVPKGHSMNYMDALHQLIIGFLLLVVVPTRLLIMPFMPQAVRKIGLARFEFFSFSKEMLEEERRLKIDSNEPRNHMLALLATVGDDNADAMEKEAQSQRPALTEEEVTGNLYQFTLAGFDTTANTLAYAFATLAAYPEWQDWIVEEIDRVRREVSDPTDYNQVYPRLERCLALMVRRTISWEIVEPQFDLSTNTCCSSKHYGSTPQSPTSSASAPSSRL
jgi:cytochrome P450